MRHGRTMHLIALSAALAGSILAAPVALADSGITAEAESSASAATSSAATSAPATTSTPPATTSTAPATTSAPALTEGTSSGCPATASSGGASGGSDAGCGTTSTPVALEATPTTPTTPTPTATAARGEAPGGGGELPFTGPGDVVLALVLAMLAGSGGILFMAGATGREQIDGLSRRSMASPSGFKLAYRELLRQQVDG